MPAADFVYLASQSPRRRQLLDQLGVRHLPLLAAAHEDTEHLEAALPGEGPAGYVERVTALKLGAAVERWRERRLAPAPILVADTTVALGRRILGKPDDAKHAGQMLSALSGRTHRVLTAVALWDGRRTHQALSRSHVRFAELTPEVIDSYVASREPFGKAGAYAIQSALAGWIEHIEGSYSGIMGLPLFETRALLARCGVAVLPAPAAA